MLPQGVQCPPSKDYLGLHSSGSNRSASGKMRRGAPDFKLTIWLTSIDRQAALQNE